MVVSFCVWIVFLPPDTPEPHGSFTLPRAPFYTNLRTQSDLFPKTGDLNDDGMADLLCYSNMTRGTEIFLGSAQPDTVPTYHWPDIDGWEIVRDMNGDGHDDLLKVRNVTRVSLVWGGIPLDTTERAHMNYQVCSGSSPEEVLPAGDFNHDGYQDVVMFNHYCTGWYYGVLALYLGGPWINPEPAFVIEGWTDPLNLIHFKAAVNLGDVNGDGVDDLAIGANGEIEHAAQRGKVVILGGDDSLHVAVGAQRPEIPQHLDVTVYPNPFNGEATISLDVPPGVRTVILRTYNVLGQLVAHEDFPASLGVMHHSFNARDLPSGLYLMKVQAGSYQTTQKLMLLK
jgi:hypothetical protein